MASKVFIIKDGVLTKYKGDGGDVVIPDGVTSIEEAAFYGCDGLTSITIPSSVTSIGERAFDGCTGLTFITIPDSVTFIGLDAFDGCEGLTSIEVNRDNPTYRSENNCLIEKETNTLIAGCKTSVIPDSVTSIGWGAFNGCTGLTSITIPDGVTSLDGCTFFGCTGLTSITIPDSVTYIGEYVFSDCIGLTSITIPSSVTSIVCGAFDGCKFTTVNYLGTREEWRDIKWLDDSEIKEIRCSDGVITREEEEWRSQGFVVEDGVLTDYSGEGDDVVISDGVTSIGDGAFLFCEGVTSITIPESVTSIEENAFTGCTALDSITYAGTIAEWLSIKKGSNWDLDTGDYVIHCTDGDVAKDE